MATRKPATTTALKKGEILVGLTLHEGKPHHLILLAGDERMAWDKAVAWAKKKGGSLPSRIDMLVLFERTADKFQKTWYWSGQECAGTADYAWIQLFFNGTQNYGHKSNYCRCRAVRRVPI